MDPIKKSKRFLKIIYRNFPEDPWQKKSKKGRFWTPPGPPLFSPILTKTPLPGVLIIRQIGPVCTLSHTPPKLYRCVWLPWNPEFAQFCTVRRDPFFDPFLALFPLFPSVWTSRNPLFAQKPRKSWRPAWAWDLKIWILGPVLKAAEFSIKHNQAKTPDIVAPLPLVSFVTTHPHVKKWVKQIKPDRTCRKCKKFYSKLSCYSYFLTCRCVVWVPVKIMKTGSKKGRKKGPPKNCAKLWVLGEGGSLSRRKSFGGGVRKCANRTDLSNY